MGDCWAVAGRNPSAMKYVRRLWRYRVEETAEVGGVNEGLEWR